MDGVIYTEETAGVRGSPESDTELLRASVLWVWTDFCIPHLLWIPRLQEDFQD